MPSNASGVMQVAALLAPDPQPGHLTVAVTQSMGCDFASGLGLCSTVPRFLRWSGRLVLQSCSTEVLLSVPAAQSMSVHQTMSLACCAWPLHGAWSICLLTSLIGYAYCAGNRCLGKGDSG